MALDDGMRHKEGGRAVMNLIVGAVVLTLAFLLLVVIFSYPKVSVSLIMVGLFIVSVYELGGLIRGR